MKERTLPTDAQARSLAAAMATSSPRNAGPALANGRGGGAKPPPSASPSPQLSCPPDPAWPPAPGYEHCFMRQPAAQDRPVGPWGWTRWRDPSPPAFLPGRDLDDDFEFMSRWSPCGVGFALSPGGKCLPVAIASAVSSYVHPILWLPCSVHEANFRNSQRMLYAAWLAAEKNCKAAMKIATADGLLQPVLAACGVATAAQLSGKCGCGSASGEATVACAGACIVENYQDAKSCTAAADPFLVKALAAYCHPFKKFISLPDGELSKVRAVLNLGVAGQALPGVAGAYELMRISLAAGILNNCPWAVERLPHGPETKWRIGPIPVYEFATSWNGAAVFNVCKWASGVIASLVPPEVLAQLPSVPSAFGPLDPIYAWFCLKKPAEAKGE